MPRACPVEVHAGCYLPTQKTNSKQRETPPRKAVASSKVGCCSFLAANVNLPRTSRGHPPTVLHSLYRAVVLTSLTLRVVMLIVELTAPHEWRMTSSGGALIFRYRRAVFFPSISSNSNSAAAWPIADVDQETVVSGTRSMSP